MDWSGLSCRPLNRSVPICPDKKIDKKKRRQLPFTPFVGIALPDLIRIGQHYRCRPHYQYPYTIFNIGLLEHRIENDLSGRINPCWLDDCRQIGDTLNAESGTRI